MGNNSFKILREKNGLSVEQAATLLDVCEKTIYRWESGENKPKAAFYTVLENRLEKKLGKKDRKTEFTFIDLFAGIGGMRKGFEAVGGECVFTSEWDSYAVRTYMANFPEDHTIVGDITRVNEAEIPSHDILLAGFPCQPFSIAGVSKKKALGRAHGFMDKTQGTLFFDVLRIIEYHHPSAFLLENVKNLKGHDKGRTFRIITESLESLGYKISTRIIDGAGYVPQHRERIFIAGFCKDTGFDFEKLDFANPASGPKLHSILHSPDEYPEGHYTIPVLSQKSNRNSRVSDKYTLSNKLWQYLKDYAEKHRERGNGFGFGLNGPEDRARTLSARYYKDGSEILIRQAGNNPRRLTPRECARLMGFDKPGHPPMEIPVSDTRAYKQFGNAVIVPVIEDIAKYMKPHLMRIKEPGELFERVSTNRKITSKKLRTAIA